MKTAILMCLALALCGCRSAPKATPISNSTAVGPGVTTGGYNLLIGHNAGYEVVDDNYVLCIGDDTCRGKARLPDCTVDATFNFSRPYQPTYADWKWTTDHVVIPILKHCPATVEQISATSWWVGIGQEALQKEKVRP